MKKDKDIHGYPAQYHHYICGNCKAEIYLLTNDLKAKVDCRKCRVPMGEKIIGENVRENKKKKSF